MPSRPEAWMDVVGVVLQREGAVGIALVIAACVVVLGVILVWAVVRVRRSEGLRRRVEERLRRSEDRFQTTLDALPIGVWFVNESGRMTYGNPAAKRIWGGSSMATVSDLGAYKGWWPETGEPIRVDEWAAARAVHERETTIDEEVEIETFAGERRLMRHSAVPLIGDDDGGHGAILLNEDITAERQAEAARERARAEAERNARDEEALRLATEAVSSAYTVEEVIDRIVRSALEATQADSCLIETVGDGEAVVVAAAGVRRLPVGARVPYEGSLAQRVIERGEPIRIADLESDPRVPEHLSHSCDRCATLAVPMVDPTGAVGALLLMREAGRPRLTDEEVQRAATFADLASIAFRKVQLLEAAQYKRDELQRVLERQVRMVRGFSHDMKNPLGAADGHLALFEEGAIDSLTDRQRDAIVRVRRSIGVALRLVESLVEFARAEAGQVRIRVGEIDVRHIASDIVKEYHAAAAAKGIELRLELEEEVGAIRSDADRIRQILGNLISNAIKYTEEGEVAVRIESVECARAAGQGAGVARDPRVAIAVADTGVGVPAEHQEEIFEEFIRLDESDRGGSAGLGLAISRRLARLLGGDLTLESEVGQGSTFTLWLPLDVASREGAEAPQPESV